MGQRLASHVLPVMPPTYKQGVWLAVALDMSSGQPVPLRWIPTKRGQPMPAYFITMPEARFTVLYSHANAEELGLIRVRLYQVALRLNVNMLLYDYKGYGLHRGGQPREQDLYDDIEAAFDYATGVLDIPWDRIVLWGRSIGTAPTMHLASRRAVRGIILQSPMLSIFRIVLDLRFTMPGDLFPNIDFARLVECPVLVVHGTEDELVPSKHGWRLLQALSRRIDGCAGLVVQGGDHNGLEEQAGGRLDRAFDWFLRSLQAKAPSEKLMAQAARCNI